jgi:small conductance mechanosensitive channel
MNLQLNAVYQTAATLLTTVGLRVVAAIILWFVGRVLIRFIVRMVVRALDRQAFDATIVNYVRSSLGIFLTFLLVIAELSVFGVETTTFAALLAGAGLAVGAAWSGLLQNFASGAALVITRPFKVGDLVTVADVTGVVRNIGLFRTTIDAPDNVQTIIGNGAILADKIRNYTANRYRRIDFEVPLDHTVDSGRAIQLVKDALKSIPNVAEKPEPKVGIVNFTLAGPVLAVRPFAAVEHYWQVYFDTGRTIHRVLSSSGFNIPGERYYDIAEAPVVPAAGIERAQ